MEYNMKEFIGEISSDFKKDENKFYLAVVGNRTINDKNGIFRIINNTLLLLDEKFDINKNNVVIVTGGARGVDSIACDYARENKLECIIIKPNWKRYKSGAGLRRNREILNLASFVLIIIESVSGGSKFNINFVKKNNIPHLIVNYVEENNK